MIERRCTIRIAAFLFNLKKVVNHRLKR